MAVAVMLLCFAPFLWWNAQYDWQTFRFNFAARRAVMHLTLRGLAVFLGRQSAMVGPVLAAWALVGPAGWTWHKVRTGQPAVFALAAGGYFPFLVYAALKLIREPEAVAINWTGPLFPLLLIILVWAAAESSVQRHWLQAATFVGAVTAMGLGGGLAGMTLLGPEQVGRLMGWVQGPRGVERNLVATFGPYVIGQEIDALALAQPTDQPAFFMARRYDLASEDTQCSHRVPLVLDIGNDIIYGRCFDYWNEPARHLGQDCYYISDHIPSPKLVDRLKACFRSVRELKPEERKPYHPSLSSQFHILYCREALGFPQMQDVARWRELDAALHHAAAATAPAAR